MIKQAKFARIRAAFTVACAAIGIASGCAASAQEYPTTTIRLIVPWPAGGIVDIAARTIADKVKDDLKQPIIIENRTGAGGAIGAAEVARAGADGYTLLFTTSALNMNASIRHTSYDVLRDFAPMVIVAHSPLILVATPSLHVKSVSDLVALAKSKPGTLTFASPGIGSPAHFTGEMLRQRAGIDILHIPYQGAPRAMTDVIAGRVSFIFANAAVGLPQIKAGAVTALAITSERRSPLLPQIPTMAEAGFADFHADQWLGFLAPAATPKPVIEAFDKAVENALKSDDVKAAFLRNGMNVVADSTPTAFTAFMKTDLDNWAQIAKRANIKPQ